jgi:hypothetical protein
MTDRDSPATHTGTMTWPLDSMNGDAGERLLQLWECEYGWTSGGFRWKQDGSSPQARIIECGEPKWIETYFGLRVSSIEPRNPEELRLFHLMAVERTRSHRAWAGSEKDRTTRALVSATQDHLAARLALDAFDKEHGTGEAES